MQTALSSLYPGAHGEWERVQLTRGSPCTTVMFVFPCAGIIKGLLCPPLGDQDLGGQKDKTQQLFSTSSLSGVHIADLRACLGAQSSLGLATHSAPADTDSPA